MEGWVISMDRDRITTASEVSGGFLVALGAAMIYPAAGLIVAGVLLIVAGVMAGRL